MSQSTNFYAAEYSGKFVARVSHLEPGGRDMMLDMSTIEGGYKTGDITCFLSPENATAIIAALAAILHLEVTPEIQEENNETKEERFNRELNAAISQEPYLKDA